MKNGLRCGFELRLLVGISTFAILAAVPPEAAAWGQGAHRAAQRRAIRGLPKELRGFFERHELEMPALSPDQRSVREDAERRFAIDRMMRFPFTDLPQTEASFKERFGAEAATVGRLPWLVQESFVRLTAALKSKDKNTILDEADRLAALVTDIHNPLALTENYDGQMTRQDGLWIRFAVRLPDALEWELKLKGDVAHLIDDSDVHVFSMVRQSYVWLDNLLYEEELAARNRTDYTSLYFEAFEGRVKDMLELLLGQAVRDVSSYWYTAWIRAGRPNLDERD